MNAPSTTSPVRFRPATALLVVSLALNASLLWYLVLTKSAAVESAKSSRLTYADEAVQVQQTSVSTDAGPLRWKNLSAHGYSALRDQLLAAGCPKETVRLIIETVIDREYLPKLMENFAKGRPNFWDEAVLIKTPRNLPPNPRAKEAQRAFDTLQDERDSLIRSLVNPEFNRRNPMRPLEEEFDPATAFLSEEKQKFIASHGREIMDLWQSWPRAGIPQKEIEAKVGELRRQHQTELSTILTPEELEEYTLRSSRFNWVVQNLYSFEPTPAERKAIIQLYEAHNGPAPEAELKKVLGDERAIHFQRARDDKFADVYKVVGPLKVPDDSIARVVELRSTAEAEAKAIRDRSGLAASEQKELLRRLHAETVSNVTKEFGAAARDAYLGNGGWWINNLDPK